MRKKLTALLLACLLLVCLVLPVSAADAPALFGTANAADGTVTVTLSLRGGSAVRSGAFTLSYDSSLTRALYKALIASGMKPGKEIGEKLEELLKLVIEDPKLNTKEELLKRLN